MIVDAHHHLWNRARHDHGWLATPGLEAIVANAQRRAVLNGEKIAVPRPVGALDGGEMAPDPSPSGEATT